MSAYERKSIGESADALLVERAEDLRASAVDEPERRWIEQARDMLTAQGRIGITHRRRLRNILAEHDRPRKMWL